MSVRTVKLSDNKYQYDIEVNTGMLLTVRRNGVYWPEGFESSRFSKSIMAMLWRIIDLEDQQANHLALDHCAEARVTTIDDSEGGTCD